jgi:hypothetical protein
MTLTASEIRLYETKKALEALSKEELVAVAWNLTLMSQIQRDCLQQNADEIERLQLKLKAYKLQAAQGITLMLKKEWSGVEKVIHALEQTGRPMQLTELVTLISEYDPHLKAAQYPEKYLSTILNRGVKYGRLIAIQQKGIRGRFYGLAGLESSE